jgi:hypothetical protein
MKRSTLAGLVLLCIHAGFSQEKDKELEEMKSTIEGVQESAAEYRGYVNELRKIKITGLLHAQYRNTDLEGTLASYSGGNFPANVNKAFELRRGRIKIQYDDVLTRFVFQIDGRQTGITVKDAYAAITEPWLQSFGFQIGIFDRPFGFEVPFSSGSRESPERSRVVQTLFPGERELGAKLFFAPQYGSLSFLRVDAGVVNGAGPLSAEFDNFKDFIGRVAVQLPFDEAAAELDLGVSGYIGNVRNATKYLWSMGSVSQGFVVDSSGSNLDAGVSRNYIGFDAQFYYDLPMIGGIALRAEVITGTQPGGSTVASPPDPFGTRLTTISPVAQPTGPIYSRDFLGWYINVVQSIGSDHQVVAKYDVYDPNTTVSGMDFVGSNNLSPADVKFSTLGLGYIYHWNQYVKFVLYYEWISNEEVNASASSNSELAPFVDNFKDNIFTFRTQLKF